MDPEETQDPTWPPTTCPHLRRARRPIELGVPDTSDERALSAYVCRDPKQADDPALYAEDGEVSRCQARGHGLCWRER